MLGFRNHPFLAKWQGVPIFGHCHFKKYIYRTLARGSGYPENANTSCMTTTARTFVVFFQQQHITYYFGDKR